MTMSNAQENHLMPTPQTPVIQVRNLTKSYGKLPVLHGVDFEVARGSIFALLGSNGAGKTTIVNILSTLLRADTGTAVSTASTSPASPRTYGSRSASPGSSRLSTKSLAGAKTSYWWPGCGMSASLVRSRTTC